VFSSSIILTQVLRSSLTEPSATVVVDSSLRAIEAFGVHGFMAKMFSESVDTREVLLTLIAELPLPEATGTRTRPFFTPTPATPSVQGTPSRTTVESTRDKAEEKLKIANSYRMGSSAEGLFESVLFTLSTLVCEGDDSGNLIIGKLASWAPTLKLVAFVASVPWGQRGTDNMYQDGLIEAWRLLSKIFRFIYAKTKLGDGLFAISSDCNEHMSLFLDNLEKGVQCVVGSNVLSGEDRTGVCEYASYVCKCAYDTLAVPSESASSEKHVIARTTMAQERLLAILKQIKAAE